MKRIGRNAILLLLCLVMTAGLLPLGADAADGDVEINETNFPDANFRSYVSGSSIDTDQNGVLSQSERESVTTLNVSNKNIASLTGIEWFSRITKLQCGSNQLTVLDVSQNALLQELYCGANQLTALYLGRNTALSVLGCSDNQLPFLDVTKNTGLKNINCSRNQLASLNVTKNTALTELTCSDNQLESLDLSKNTALVTLECGNNPLKSADISNCAELRRIHCIGSPIGKLDFTGCTKMNAAVRTSRKYYMDPPCIEIGTTISGSTRYSYIPITTRVQYDDTEPPIIIAQPRTAYTVPGKTVTFSFTAATPRGAGLTYSWRKNGLLISGENGPTLTVAVDDTMDGDMYFCRVMNEGGFVHTEPVTIELVEKPTITAHPKAASVKAGKKVTFKVKAAGEGLKYQWYYLKPKTTKWVKFSGAAKATYSFTAKKTKNGYKYRCTVTNAAGSVTSRAVKLTVKSR